MKVAEGLGMSLRVSYAHLCCFPLMSKDVSAKWLPLSEEYRRAFKGESCFFCGLPSDINLSSHLTHLRSLESLATTGFSHPPYGEGVLRHNRAPLILSHDILRKHPCYGNTLIDFGSTKDWKSTSLNQL